ARRSLARTSVATGVPEYVIVCTSSGPFWRTGVADSLPIRTSTTGSAAPPNASQATPAWLVVGTVRRSSTRFQRDPGSMTHAPPAQVRPLPHIMQALPPLPHAVGALPLSHTPPKQHPAQFAGEH